MKYHYVGLTHGNAALLIRYCNYFAMRNQGPYAIVVNVRRLGDGKTVTARFQYWHARR